MARERAHHEIVLRVMNELMQIFTMCQIRTLLYYLRHFPVTPSSSDKWEVYTLGCNLLWSLQSHHASLNNLLSSLTDSRTNVLTENILEEQTGLLYNWLAGRRSAFLFLRFSMANYVQQRCCIHLSAQLHLHSSRKNNKCSQSYCDWQLKVIRRYLSSSSSCVPYSYPMIFQKRKI